VALRRRLAQAALWTIVAVRVAGVASAAFIITTCSTAAPRQATRTVTSQHRGWTIQVTPTFRDQWSARVRVWPAEVNPQTHGGIELHFAESATTESAIIQRGTAAARRYIDAFHSVNP